MSDVIVVPTQVWRDKTLSRAAKAVYVEISSYDWSVNGRGCFASQRRMAEEIGCSVRMLRNALKELEGRGLITVERGTTARGGRKNTYRVVRDGGLTVGEEQPAGDAGSVDSHRQEVPDQPAPGADEVDAVEEEVPPKRDRARLSPEKQKAQALLSYMNEKLGTHWKSDQARGRALARVRQFSDLTLDDLRGVVDRIVAEAWWEREGAAPDLGLVFGVRVWERAVGAGGGRTMDEINQANYRALERSAQ
jgi:uncharacterized phage protein (TIGR02220 family)